MLHPRLTAAAESCSSSYPPVPSQPSTPTSQRPGSKCSFDADQASRGAFRHDESESLGRTHGKQVSASIDVGMHGRWRETGACLCSNRPSRNDRAESDARVSRRQGSVLVRSPSGLRVTGGVTHLLAKLRDDSGPWVAGGRAYPRWMSASRKATSCSAGTASGARR
jgi:hypothetical protein